MHRSLCAHFRRQVALHFAMRKSCNIEEEEECDIMRMKQAREKERA